MDCCSHTVTVSDRLFPAAAQPLTWHAGCMQARLSGFSAWCLLATDMHVCFPDTFLSEHAVFCWPALHCSSAFPPSDIHSTLSFLCTSAGPSSAPVLYRSTCVPHALCFFRFTNQPAPPNQFPRCSPPAPPVRVTLFRDALVITSMLTVVEAQPTTTAISSSAFNSRQSGGAAACTAPTAWGPSRSQAPC